MSFSITDSGKPADLAHRVRSNDHHKHGEHTQFDKAREYVAEEIERAPSPDHNVSISISGHHDETNRSITISIWATPPIPDPVSIEPGIDLTDTELKTL